MVDNEKRSDSVQSTSLEEFHDVLDLMNAGKYEVHTRSGTVYEVVAEPDGVSTLTRKPADSLHNSMRHDSEPSPIFAVLLCQVGRQAHFNLFGISDDPEFYTQRITTPVTKIVKLS